MSEFSIKSFKNEDNDIRYKIIIINEMYSKDDMIHLARLVLDMVDCGRKSFDEQHKKLSKMRTGKNSTKV